MREREAANPELLTAAEVVTRMGEQALGQGDLPLAAAYGEEGLALLKEAGATARLPFQLNLLASVATLSGDFDRAEALLTESLELSAEGDDPRAMADGLTRYGELTEARGEHAQAAGVYRQSLALCREMADRGGLARAIEGLAAAAVMGGDAERSARLFGAAAALHEAPRSPVAEQVLAGRTAAARMWVGDERFERLHAEGRTLGVDAAVRLAEEV